MRRLTRRGFNACLAAIPAAAMIGGRSSVAVGQQPAASRLLPALKPGKWETLKLTWDRPEPVNTFLGTPIGNGHIGGRIEGGVASEVLTLNDKWFWSGGPGLTPPDPARRVAMLETRRVLAAGDIPAAEETARGMWGSNDMGTFRPLGNLTLTFTHGEANTSGYSRVLDLDQALSTVRYTIGDTTYTRQTFASHPHDVIVIRLSSNVAGRISFSAALSYPVEMEGQGASVSMDGSDVIVLKGRAPSNTGWDPQKGMRFEARLKIIPQGGTMTTDGQGTLVIANADSALLIFASATSYNGFDKEPGTQGIDPHPIVSATLAKAAPLTFDALLESHVTDHQSLFRRVWVDINQGREPDAHALGFQFARYEMIAVSRHGNRPHNQQGMWNNRWNPTSHSAHWLNENVQKYYALIEPANLAECGEPLWNWMKELAISGAETAKIDWGFRGWVAGQCTDIWAKTTLADGNNEWSIWPMGGVWLCQHLYDHYAFSLDRQFLQDRAYPIMKGAAEFCLDYLVEKDGYLVTSPSTSPENRFGLTPGGTAYAVTVGSTLDFALIRELFEDTINAAKVLGVDPEFQGVLQAAMAKLPPFKIGANGELQEWLADYSRLPADPRNRFTPHRHASHIVAAWPLRQITDRTPELFAATKLALENRTTGGYHPDKGAMWARLKEGDKAIGSNDTMPTTPNRLTGQHPPKYGAFAELLVQSHAGAIEILPALPTTWRNGAVSGLRARGGYELSIEWKDGNLSACQIDSRFGTTPKVRYRGQDLDPTRDARFTIIRLT